MIKISPDRITSLADLYLAEMEDGIKKRYKDCIHSINTFTQQPVSALLENGTGILDDQLVRKLLTASLEDIQNQYPDIDSYMRTCQLVYYSGFRINKELERRETSCKQVKRMEYREKYVDTYRSDWIEPILKKHHNYSKSKLFFDRFIDEIRRGIEVLNINLNNIFNYEKYIKAEFRHHLLNRIGIDVCPYCNRQFITQFLDKNKFKTTADLDHFYPKSQFTLFSLSIFNFVPSCQICNSRFKLDKGIKILNPYTAGFDQDTYFQILLGPNTKIDSLLGEDTDFELELVTSITGLESIPIHNNIELFNLNKVYQSHKDYVRELLYKKNAYSEAYKADLKELLSSLNLSDKELNLFQYGFALEPHEFGKRPLSKLAYDIIHRNS
ncbi:hypothetical protein MKZ07_06310 [Paenibacillus sp. FSL P4-0338]|uniref:hypothetical protein n=1 Tax=Paenibacillus sp. FSL P4-0338 TaxID=2921635 RepID=UPI0030F67443